MAENLLTPKDIIVNKYYLLGDNSIAICKDIISRDGIRFAIMIDQHNKEELICLAGQICLSPITPQFVNSEIAKLQKYYTKHLNKLVEIQKQIEFINNINK